VSGAQPARSAAQPTFDLGVVAEPTRARVDCRIYVDAYRWPRRCAPPCVGPRPLRPHRCPPADRFPQKVNPAKRLVRAPTVRSRLAPRRGTRDPRARPHTSELGAASERTCTRWKTVIEATALARSWVEQTVARDGDDLRPSRGSGRALASSRSMLRDRSGAEHQSSLAHGGLLSQRLTACGL
jgi:hypothetical protein